MTDAPLTITVSGPRTPLRTKWLTMLRDLVGSAAPNERPQILDAAPGHAESVREFHRHQAARPETITRIQPRDLVEVMTKLFEGPPVGAIVSVGSVGGGFIAPVGYPGPGWDAAAFRFVARPCLCGSPACPQGVSRAIHRRDMIDSECVYPNCGCGEGRCRATMGQVG